MGKKAKYASRGITAAFIRAEVDALRAGRS